MADNVANESYIYQTLDLSKRQIRLVILEQCLELDSSTPISCQLKVVDITSVRYEALSYEWGNPTFEPEEEPENGKVQDKQKEEEDKENETPEPLRTFGIRMNGQGYQVQGNLYCALRHLQLQGKPRVLWIEPSAHKSIDTEQNTSETRGFDLCFLRSFVFALIGLQ